MGDVSMSKRKIIREYVSDYIKWYPERWRWSLENSDEQCQRYRETRARRSDDIYRDNDLKPDFYSIERDAEQFGLRYVKWTDFFGLNWIGEKGVRAYAGAPNYEGNLYYYCPEEDDSYDGDGYCISWDYDAYKNQPPEDTYTKIVERGVSCWVDTAHVSTIKYHYFVDNHLFKDTYIVLKYRDGEELRIYSDYENLIRGLRRHGKDKLIRSLFRTMNEHFIKLRDSEREEVREFYPGETAEEMFAEEDE